MRDSNRSTLVADVAEVKKIVFFAKGDLAFYNDYRQITDIFTDSYYTSPIGNTPTDIMTAVNDALDDFVDGGSNFNDLSGLRILAYSGIDDGLDVIKALTNYTAYLTKTGNASSTDF